MSARPASFGLSTPITLPMSCGPAAPVAATAACTSAAISASDSCCRHIGGQASPARPFPCRPDRCDQPASNWLIESLRCLIILSMTAVIAASSSVDALVDFALLDRGEQQADRAETLGLTCAHGGFHVVGDLVFETHHSPECVGIEKPARLIASARASTRIPAWDCFLKRVGTLCVMVATLPAGPKGRVFRDGTCRAVTG